MIYFRKEGMHRPKFKQKCALCKKNMVTMYSARQFPICPDCQMKRVKDEVKDPEYRFLNIDEGLLRKSSFLRSIKEQYLYKGTLSEKQIEAFKKVVKEWAGKVPESP